MTNIGKSFRQFTKKTSLLGATSALLLSAKPVLAQGPRGWDGVCVNRDAGFDVATIQGLQCLLANILMSAVTIIGLVGFLIFIVSAFRYMLSGGESKGIESAKNGMTYAIVGLVVALSAVIILNLLTALTGVDFSTFLIPNSDSGFQ